MVRADEFREALKDYPAGVTIVTAADEAGSPYGATVSAFASLSLQPPLVLVCLRGDSRTAAAVRSRRAFVVHFLDSSQTSLARRFAVDRADKFEAVASTLNAAGVPCLSDCRPRLECSLQAEYGGGDHAIFVGLVEATESVQQFEPLVYAQRHFFGLGSPAVEA